MAERKIQFTTNKGVFVAQMFEEKAPQTTKNFAVKNIIIGESK